MDRWCCRESVRTSERALRERRDVTKVLPSWIPPLLLPSPPSTLSRQPTTPAPLPHIQTHAIILCVFHATIPGCHALCEIPPLANRCHLRCPSCPHRNIVTRYSASVEQLHALHAVSQLLLLPTRRSIHICNRRCQLAATRTVRTPTPDVRIIDSSAHPPLLHRSDTPGPHRPSGSLRRPCPRCSVMHCTAHGGSPSPSSGNRRRPPCSNTSERPLEEMRLLERCGWWRM